MAFLIFGDIYRLLQALPELKKAHGGRFEKDKARIRHCLKWLAKYKRALYVDDFFFGPSQNQHDYLMWVWNSHIRHNVLNYFETSQKNVFVPEAAHALDIVTDFYVLGENVQKIWLTVKDITLNTVWYKKRPRRRWCHLKVDSAHPRAPTPICRQGLYVLTFPFHYSELRVNEGAIVYKIVIFGSSFHKNLRDEMNEYCSHIDTAFPDRLMSISCDLKQTINF